MVIQLLKLKVIPWKDINQKYKNDYELVKQEVDQIMVARGIN